MRVLLAVYCSPLYACTGFVAVQATVAAAAAAATTLAMALAPAAQAAQEVMMVAEVRQRPKGL